MSFSTPYQGAVERLDLAVDQQVGDQAVSTTLTNGVLVYQDGANGIKVAPTDGSIPARRLRFAFGIPPEGQTSNATLGNKKVNTIRGPNVIVIGKCDGAISVGSYCRASETNGKNGQFQAEVVDNSTVANLAAYLNKRIAIFLGKASGAGGITTNALPADAADGDLGRFMLI
jgi:hypothetical protein